MASRDEACAFPDAFKFEDVVGAPRHPDPWPSPSGVGLVWRSDLTSYPRPPRDERDPYLYRATVPPEIASAEVSLAGEVAADLEDAARAVARLNASGEGRRYDLVASPLLRAEAVSSSRIEGLRASHRAIAEAREIPGAARQTALEITNNVKAMEAAIALADEAPLSVEMIRDIHSVLAEGVPFLKDHGGQVRTRQNWIGPSPHGPHQAQYVPPPPEDVPRLLDDLARFAARDDLPAILQAGIVHSQFEAIHPFIDGNGRVGRVLIHVVLRQRGLSPHAVPPISVVLASRRDEYDNALVAYQVRGDVQEWSRYFFRATTVAAQSAEALGGRIEALVGDWRNRAGQRRPGSSAIELLPVLVQRPIMSAGTAAGILGASDVAVRNALSDLARAGIVRQVTTGRRNRVWAAEEVFDLLDRFEHDIARAGDGRQLAPTRHLRGR